MVYTSREEDCIVDCPVYSCWQHSFYSLSMINRLDWKMNLTWVNAWLGALPQDFVSGTEIWTVEHLPTYLCSTAVTVGAGKGSASCPCRCLADCVCLSGVKRLWHFPAIMVNNTGYCCRVGTDPCICCLTTSPVPLVNNFCGAVNSSGGNYWGICKWIRSFVDALFYESFTDAALLLAVYFMG